MRAAAAFWALGWCKDNRPDGTCLQIAGQHVGVRVKDLDSHSIKALLVSRVLLVKIKRDLENQIRRLLKNLGLVIGRAKMNVFAVRAAEPTEDRPSPARLRERPRPISDANRHKLARYDLNLPPNPS